MTTTSDAFERKSLPRFIQSDVTHLASSSATVHMLTEDIGLGSIPFSRGGSESSVDIEGSTDSDRQLAVVALLGADADAIYLPRDLTEFVRNACRRLAWDGSAWFEIRRLREDSDRTNLPSGSLAEVSPGATMWWVGPRVLQWARKAVLMSDEDRRHALLKRRDLLRIRLPRALISARRHRRLLQDAAYADAVVPEFRMTDLEGSTETRGFDLDEYDRRRNAQLARITHRWGWPGRWAWDDQANTFFLARRRLEFAKSLALTREHVLSTLNQFLERENIKAKLLLRDALASSELSARLDQLQSGEISIGDLLDGIP